MGKITWVIGTATLSILWLATSCGDDSGGDKLTIASSPAANSSSQGSGGDMGTGGDGGDGVGSGGDPSMGGMGGFGGSPPEPVNGCLQATAMDLTGMDPANIAIPNGNYCIRVAQNAGVIFTLATPSAHRYMGGVVLDATNQKLPDAQSPILPSCNTSPYDCSPMVTNPPYGMVSKGAYPWYDDLNAATIRGVVYVE